MTTKPYQHRYSMPSRMTERLWTDQEYYKEVAKLKKNSNCSNFPRYDQIIRDDFLILEFALAGYSSKDLSISVSRSNVIRIHSLKQLNDDSDNRIERGSIIRGIARRKFDVSLQIDFSFDVATAVASIENGLLTISIKSADSTILDIEVGNG